MVEEGGDWDRRNRFRVYEGLFELSIRNFEKATENFLGAIATFTCVEILDYERLVTYGVISALLVLNRKELKRKVGLFSILTTFLPFPLLQVLKCSDILEVLHDLPKIRLFISSFYDCQYEKYFRTLGEHTFC